MCTRGREAPRGESPAPGQACRGSRREALAQAHGSGCPPARPCGLPVAGALSLSSPPALGLRSRREARDTGRIHRQLPAAYSPASSQGLPGGGPPLLRLTQPCASGSSHPLPGAPGRTWSPPSPEALAEPGRVGAPPRAGASPGEPLLTLPLLRAGICCALLWGLSARSDPSRFREAASGYEFSAAVLSAHEHNESCQLKEK